eukprot:8169669-Pyramimonas_sp.AAC.1
MRTAGMIRTMEREKRERRPIPVLYRARQGHSCFVPNIERMYPPYKEGMAKCRGPILHATGIDAIKGSMAGEGIIRFPAKTDGLRKERDPGLLRLIPTRRDFPEEQSEHTPLGSASGGMERPRRVKFT